MRFVLLYCIFNLFVLSSAFTQEIKKYIFIGHPYTFRNDEGLFDQRCIDLDLKNNFDRIWLGGDVLKHSMSCIEHVQQVDSVFDISNPANHWTLGNHDSWGFNWEYYNHICNRKSYYAYYADDITTLVLNTNITPIDCEKLDEQYWLIKNVCDTISESLALILIMHHNICINIPGLPPVDTLSNIPKLFWNSNCFDPGNRWFHNSIYPMLKSVKQRNIKVFCLIGDYGYNSKFADLISTDQIYFLGCGLWNTAYTTPEQIEIAGPDIVLIFEHNLTERTLNYSFHNIDTLVESLNHK
ncbi:MAG: hypothetical protein PHW83_09215 [Bacteroidales bacterium]|nr:hypothetical protein [Bacteroidales bacterium]